MAIEVSETRNGKQSRTGWTRHRSTSSTRFPEMSNRHWSGVNLTKTGNGTGSTVPNLATARGEQNDQSI